jgi:putative tryptophan/tyrosine transport system substrate-binding protein
MRKLRLLASDVEYVLVGGFMSLGPGHYEGYYGGTKCVDKILRSAKPADLPIEQLTKSGLVVNLRAAREIGLTLPSPFLVRADEVIE